VQLSNRMPQLALCCLSKCSSTFGLQDMIQSEPIAASILCLPGKVLPWVLMTWQQPAIPVLRATIFASLATHLCSVGGNCSSCGRTNRVRRVGCSCGVGCSNRRVVERVVLLWLLL
jgi:hypothetical protein